ncbi:UV radiation resistance protein/autophagy-related protein 14 [Hysterangium stoloniferum]|nr:UV radiation resistance protein/autophagy-related protein 14 [Hysterangium stoloniferum]
MECSNCQLLQRKFYCQNCLKTHLRDARSTIQHIAAERSANVERAARELTTIDKSRQIRAEIAGLEERITEVRKETQRIRDAHAAARERVAKLKASTAERRKNLVAARAFLVPSQSSQSSQSSSLQSFHSGLSQINENLAHTRKILVEELLDVFDVVEVGGRPSLGGTKGTKGEWMIGGQVLPVPGDMRRRYPPEYINAALTHTLHFLSLLTFYIGVKLPFEVTWSGDAVGVGTPYLSACKGTESGGWARWSVKHPLHIPPSSPSMSSGNGSTGSGTSASSSQTPSFTTALTMLLYNTLYLCHTQSQPVPLSQSGEILRNLWALCCTPELGRRSHQTGPGLALEPPTPPSFTVDFTQLLQVTSSGPVQRKKRRSLRRTAHGPEERDVEADDWDLIDGEF